MGCHAPYFAGEESEAQRVEVLCPVAYSQEAEEVGLDTSWAGSNMTWEATCQNTLLSA